VPKDDDTDFPPQSFPTPPHGIDCAQDRRIRELEREVRTIRERLTEGAVTMTKLRGSVVSLKESVDALTKLVGDLAKPNPVIGKIIDAAINCIVPAVIIGILCLVVWLAVGTGVVSARFAEPPAKSKGKDAPCSIFAVCSASTNGTGTPIPSTQPPAAVAAAGSSACAMP